MPNSPITDAERDQIEELLDRIGVWGMMMALSEISTAKEGHVEEAWQDLRLAKRWGRPVPPPLRLPRLLRHQDLSSKYILRLLIDV